jgi:hypothetical protein
VQRCKKLFENWQIIIIATKTFQIMRQNAGNQLAVMLQQTPVDIRKSFLGVFVFVSAGDGESIRPIKTFKLRQNEKTTRK